MPRTEKVQSVSDIKDLFSRSEAFFVTDYQGLNVADITVLRKNLREKKVTYLVAKNSLLKIGAQHAGVAGIEKYLKGPTAIAFAHDDASTAAKVLYDSFKEKKLPRVKVFVVSEQVHLAENLEVFATLPSKDVLYAQVAAAVQAPLQELVNTLDGFFQPLIGSIEALAEKKKSAA
jgi:large subunit ribosomal protein L10